MPDLTITYRRPEELSENPRNVRMHSKRQIRQIVNSIQAFGFANPILIDQHDLLIAGHGRLAAAKNLKLDRVPVIQLAGLSEKRPLRSSVMLTVEIVNARCCATRYPNLQSPRPASRTT